MINNFIFIVRALTQDPAVRDLAHYFEEHIKTKIKELDFGQELNAIGIFPIVLNPNFAVVNDSVKLSKKNKELRASLNITFEDWEKSSSEYKLLLFTENLMESINLIHDKYSIYISENNRNSLGFIIHEIYIDKGGKIPLTNGNSPCTSHYKNTESENNATENLAPLEGQIEKYIRKTSGFLEYWEYWASQNDQYYIHWGKVGEKGSLKVGVKREELVAIRQENSLDGFKKLDPSSCEQLTIQITQSILDTLSLTAEEIVTFLNEILGWMGLGECDGYDCDREFIEFFCDVVELEIAKKLIRQELESKGIYPENLK